MTDGHDRRRRAPSSPLVECIPNFSEGRRRDVVEAIAAAMRTVKGVRVLDVELDASHNRSVVTLAGPPEAVVEAAFRSVREAAARIDMGEHRGAHPRIGAADVVPLVPVRAVSMPECIAFARRLGERIGSELGIPVYMYGEAALSPDRFRLPDVRKGEYEGLRAEVATNPDRRPDFGPASLGSAGATAVGARWPLIAYNVNLASADVGIAKAIARRIREANGGLPAVRALGIALEDRGLVQVSMNLTDYHTTGLLAAYTAVAMEAARLGVAVDRSEIVGLVPQDALPGDPVSLRLRGFSRRQVLEERLRGL